MKHYIYKTTNLINGKTYIGKHSSQNIETDNYLGSGKILKKAIKKYGRQNFKKQVLHVFSIEEQAYLKQKDIVDQQFLSRKDTYNITLGGRGSWFFKRGMSAARLVQTGQIIQVTVDDSKWKTGQIEGVTHNMATARLVQTGQIIQVTVDDSKWKTGQLEGCLKGTIFITNGKQERMIKKEIPIPQGWEKGKIPGCQDGQKNPMYGKIWITNGSQNRAINRNALIPQGWKRGKTQKLSVNKQIFNLNTIK